MIASETTITIPIPTQAQLPNDMSLTLAETARIECSGINTVEFSDKPASGSSRTALSAGIISSCRRSWNRQFGLRVRIKVLTAQDADRVEKERNRCEKSVELPDYADSDQGQPDQSRSLSAWLTCMKSPIRLSDGRDKPC